MRVACSGRTRADVKIIGEGFPEFAVDVLREIGGEGRIEQFQIAMHHGDAISMQLRIKQPGRMGERAQKGEWKPSGQRGAEVEHRCAVKARGMRRARLHAAGEFRWRVSHC